MVTSDLLLRTYGDPSVNTIEWERLNMERWVIPSAIRSAVPELPGKIYMHKAFVPVVERWLTALVVGHVAHEIDTFDGCWNIRTIRGGKAMSIHSWGMAIDFNASQNPLGLTTRQAHERGLTPFSARFFSISRQFVDCGIDWPRRPDGMHFQIKARDL